MAAVRRLQDRRPPRLVTYAAYAALEARVRALELRDRPAKRDEERCVLAITASVKGCAFSAAELRAHADRDEELAAALGPCTTRSLGKFLRSVADRVICGLMVRKVTCDAGGTVWMVVQVEHLHAHHRPHGAEGA